MAVAVKSTPETAPQQPANRLAVGSLIGTLYVLGCLAILYLIPTVWRTTLSPTLVPTAGVFVDAALRLIVMLGVIALLVFVGRRLIGAHPPHGIRAGIFMGLVGVFVIGFLTRGIGRMLEGSLEASMASVGAGLTIAVGLALLVVGALAFFRTGFNRWLMQVEDQGWFSVGAYKRAQGQRVRRGTILGILVLAGSGIYTLLAHRTLETASANWEVPLPFTHGRTLLLLPDVQFTLPLLLTAAALWVAYRVVNFPTFADFLIATEAELNKVSWTTRKRLVQDTLVVLTTMLLLTGFLFVMDSIWINLLSWRWVNVLQTERADTGDLDARIENLNRERQAAVDAGEMQKVASLENQIQELSNQRERILRGKQGGPQEW